MKIIYSILLLLSISLQGNSQCYPDRHSTNWFDGWVSCNPSLNPNSARNSSHWILYDFSANYSIDKIKIWNANDPSHLNFGAKNIAVDYSEDSINWKFADILPVKIAPGNNRYEGDDWIPISIPKARFVLLTVLDNFGGDCSGFSEIRFSGEKIKISTEAQDENSSIPGNLAMMANPNPFKNELRLKINSDQTGNVSYLVSNMLGHDITHGVIRMNKSFYYLDLDTQSWSNGMYQIQIQQGKATHRILVVKL